MSVERESLPPVRPLDCGPGKVFVLEVPPEYREVDPGWPARYAELFAQQTGGSKLVILPPGCKLRGEEAPEPPAEEPVYSFGPNVKQKTWRDRDPLH